MQYFTLTQDGLTALHYAVQNNNPEMLHVLFNRLKLGGMNRDSDEAHRLVAITDSAGWSISHMAANLRKQVQEFKKVIN